MPEILKTPPISDDKPKTSPVTLAVGAVVVLAMAGSLWFLFAPFENRVQPASQGTAPAKMSEAEQDYAKNLRFENLALSRAENFLHAELLEPPATVLARGFTPDSSAEIVARDPVRLQVKVNRVAWPER